MNSERCLAVANGLRKRNETMDLQPDVQRLLRTIRHEEPDRVPLADFQVDTPIMDQFMGRPIRTVEDRMAFQAAAGFDFIYLRANYDYYGTSPVVSTGTPRSWEWSLAPESETEATFADGPLHTVADIDSYPWPDPLTVDVSHLQTAATTMPPGLGIITGVGGIFTRTWMIMGYEHFCLSLMDEPELVSRVSAQVGRIQCEVLRRLVKMPQVFAVWYGDDLAYSESLMVSPEVLRKYFFPWIEELVGIAHNASMPFIMHSDGNLWLVIEDLIALGVEAIHPIEPKAMDIYQLKRRYGAKLALFGNVDLGYMLVEGTGRPEDVRAEVRRLIRDLAPGGGYAVSSGAGITRYVTLENFKAMRDATIEFGEYPICA
jgi:uroporphyrinogen decarboxylase